MAVTPAPQAADDRGSTLARVLALAALVGGIVLVATMLFGDDGGRQYKLLFGTGGQLVPGNEVLVAGQNIGSVDSLDLTDDGQAEVTISVNKPLPMGTQAEIRATSLSGIANRYVSLDMGASDEEIPDGSTIASDSTTTPVDIDQLFSLFDDKTRKAFQDVFKGQAAIYAGDPQKSREAYKFLAPGLASTRRLLEELTRDQQVFSQFLTNGADVLGSIAARRDDLSSLTENANVALSAIASENEALDRTLAALPDTMRQANTTFLNLRVALDDVDKLVETAKPATVDLPQFLRDLRPVANGSVPVVNDLADTVRLDGPSNDLTDALRQMPALEALANDASDQGIDAMNVSEENVAVFRAYTPEVMGLVTKLGQLTATYSADGHYARALPVTNIFSYDDGSNQLNPQFNTPSTQYDFYTGTPNAFSPFGFQRCPGAASQPAADGSTPFVEDEVTGNCDPAAIPFGVGP